MQDSNAVGNNPSSRDSAGTLQILLVDDSALVRVHMVELLDDAAKHVEIRHAGDVPSGVRLMEQWRPDVMIFDIDLPGQSGLDLLKIARRKFTHAIIVMMSMHDH